MDLEGSELARLLLGCHELHLQYPRRLVLGLRVSTTAWYSLCELVLNRTLLLSTETGSVLR
eukprot:2938126-Rhodomonas_salina.3